MENLPLLQTRENGINHISSRKFYNTLRFGILCIGIASFVIQTELAQLIQAGNKYHKPYFILWLAHSCWAIMIPIQFVFHPNFRTYISEFIDTARELVFKVNQTNSIDIDTRNEESDAIEQHIIIPISREYIFAYLFKIIFFFALCICFIGYIWYVAVNYTSMANLTAIYNTSCFWTYVFSVFLLGESVKIEKVGSVFLSIIGVIIMTMNQKDNKPVFGEDAKVGDNSISFAGDLIAVVGAVVFGLYETLYKKYGSPPTPSILFSNTITGLIGIFTLIFLWVPIPILHYMGIEEFYLPDMKTFGYILLMVSFGVAFNASFMIVISLTSPIFAAIGIMLTIPLVAFVDALIIQSSLDANTIIGGLFITASFILLSWESIRVEIEKRTLDSRV